MSQTAAADPFPPAALAVPVHAPPSLAAPVLSATGLSVQKNGRTLLDGVDIDIRPGEIVTVIGPNGAGKTTLIRALLGLELLAAGVLSRAPGLRLGYVPQKFDIDRSLPMTAERFLRLGSPVVPATLTRILAEVGATRVAGRQLAQLSGGELQRVVLARALLREPQLLVLDEPARGVDFTGEAELYALIGRLAATRGLAVLLVSHDLHVVMAASDRVICLNRHVCCSGVPDAVAQHPEYARLFGAEAGRMLGVYRHRHNHTHDIAGDIASGAGHVHGEHCDHSHDHIVAGD